MILLMYETSIRSFDCRCRRSNVDVHQQMLLLFVLDLLLCNHTLSHCRDTSRASLESFCCSRSYRRQQTIVFRLLYNLLCKQLFCYELPLTRMPKKKLLQMRLICCLLHNRYWPYRSHIVYRLHVLHMSMESFFGRHYTHIHNSNTLIACICVYKQYRREMLLFFFDNSKEF